MIFFRSNVEPRNTIPPAVQLWEKTRSTWAPDMGPAIGLRPDLGASLGCHPIRLSSLLPIGEGWHQGPRIRNKGLLITAEEMKRKDVKKMTM